MGLTFAEVNRQVESLIGKILGGFDAIDMTGQLSETKEKLRISLKKREKVKLVLVGQYSAGKSSLLKMLTGNDDIRIAPGITTDKATTYEWGCVEIVDTPGIDTKLRPEHDEISQQAIREADMLIFVITNELFDNLIAKDFRDIAFEKKKADEMILVVNKMGRTRLGNTTEQQSIIAEDLEKVTAPRHPREFYISFVDAKDYLDAQEETDEDCAKELTEGSGYEAFMETLNRFIEEKGVMAKLIRPLHECREILDEVAESNANIEREDQEEFEDKKYALQAAKEEFTANVRLYSDNAVSEIESTGGDLIQDIHYGADQSWLDDRAKNTNWEIGNSIENFRGHIEDEIASLEQKINIQVEEASGLSRDGANISVSPVGNANMQGTILKGADNAGKGLGKFGAELAAQTTRQVADGLGYTNAFSRFWHSAEITKAAQIQRLGGKALQGGAALAGIAIQAYSEHQRNEAERKINEEKEKVANEIKDIVRDIKNGTKQCIEEVGKVIDQEIKALDERTASAQAKERERTENSNIIDSYKEEINELLDSLHGKAPHYES